VNCHGASGGYNFETYANTMSGGVVKGNASQSPLYTAISSGRMPKGGSVSAANLKLIYDWIQSGAPNN
jgi:hypothetical protein